MLDIKFVRENPEIVKQNIRNKFQDNKLELVDKVIELDKENREIKQEVEALRAERNKTSKQIGALMAQGKRDEAEEVKKQVAASGARIDELSAREKEVEEDKVKILAQLYKSYINGNLDWDELIHSSEIVRNLFLIDLIQLKSLYSEKEIKRNDGYYPFSMSRLNSLGLVEYYNGLLVNSQDNPGTQIIGKINELGEDFFKYAILDSGIELHEE